MWCVVYADIRLLLLQIISILTSVKYFAFIYPKMPISQKETNLGVLCTDMMRLLILTLIMKVK